MLHVVFTAKLSPCDGKSSDPVDNAEFDFLLNSFEVMMSRESPPQEGDALMVLCDLQKRRDALNALDLSGRIKETAAKLRFNREEQLHEVVKLRAINTTSEVQLTSSLQHIQGHIGAQRQTCQRLQLEAFRAKSALGKAELYSEQEDFRYHCAFTTLRRLEASERALREDPLLAVREAPKTNLIAMTNEEIEGRTKELIRRLHADAIQELTRRLLPFCGLRLSFALL